MSTTNRKRYAWNAQEVDKMVAILPVAMSADLKELIGQEADKVNLPMNEWIVRLIATHLKRPDLAFVPRKRSGRPRKELTPGNGHKKLAKVS